SIAYFTSVLPTSDHTQEQADALVKDNARRLLRDEMVALWPGACERYPTDFRWDLLAVPPEHEDSVTGEARLDHQFFQANVEPSPGYVLSLPGTARYRLDPGQSGFENLYLAGDWTQCQINAGCVEAAVISGLRAAEAITRKRRNIVGYSIDRWPEL